MEFFFIFLGIIAAGVAGFLFGRKLSSNSQEKHRLEIELKEKHEELDAFRNKVNNHFEKTANLFNQVSDSYQSLYEHMAKSSTQLCATPTFQGLPKSEDVKLDTKSQVKRKTNNDEKNMFDANRLYYAHDYRNSQENAEELEIKAADSEKSANVVDIESAKDEKVEPALDYAIKPKGVVNHDSLNMSHTQKTKA